MERIITCDNLRQFAYINDRICQQPIRGIVLSFFGLGSCGMYNKDIMEGELCAENGVLYVAPYTNPWSWMNRQAVSYTDEIVDVLLEKFQLSEDIPIISTGGSMGGQSALVYCAYAKRTPKACVTDCPVCDVVYHFNERIDLPRTMYSALYQENCSFDEALRSISPIHLVGKLPKIPYHILHCGNDSMVNLDAHSRKFVKAMTENGYEATLDIIPGKDHCDLSFDGKRKYAAYALKYIL